MHTETQRKVDVGKQKPSVLSLADTRQPAFSSFSSSSLYLSSPRISLLWNPNQITPAAFQPILVTFVWGFLPYRKGLVYNLFFYFEFSLIYFVRSHYKTVKKDFSVCKMIFFISRRHRQAERASLGMTATLRCVYIC